MPTPRPRAAIAAGALALLLGSGTAGGVALDDDDAPPARPTASGTGVPTPTASPSTPEDPSSPDTPAVVVPSVAPGPDDVPPDLPLAQGLPETTADGTPVATTPGPAFRGLRVCGAPAWRPGRLVDAVGVRYAEAGERRTRTLAVLADAATATRAVTRLRDALARCGTGVRAWQLIATPSPDPAQELVVATRTTPAADLLVLRIARMGRAVLIVSDLDTPRPLPVVDGPTGTTAPTTDPALVAEALERSAADSTEVIAAMAATWPPG
ncbi:hypothetical protein [Nocardioides sp.]|uniref:hypothetical protein n=1 Tax=Nocardioides sp. TaxID=35761 RepID=UPI003518F711